MRIYSLTQKGIVLVTGMMLLLVLTVIGIATMGSTALQEKMTQNLRDVSTAFTASEAALVDGEQWLFSQTALPSSVSTCSTPPCRVWTAGTIGNAYTQSSSWWNTNGTHFSTVFSGVSSQPAYIIEQYGFTATELSPDAASKGKGYYYYRVSARGVGGTANSAVNLQSIYCMQFN